MNKKELIIWILIAIAVVVVAIFIIRGTSNNQDAMNGEENQDELEVTSSPALVDSVEVVMLESFPVQVSVNVEGNLSDGCSELGVETINRSGNMFMVSLPQVRPADAVCTQALRPFATTFELDVLGLTKGMYTVNVNGVEAQFEILADNEVTFESEK